MCVILHFEVKKNWIHLGIILIKKDSSLSLIFAMIWIKRSFIHRISKLLKTQISLVWNLSKLLNYFGITLGMKFHVSSIIVFECKRLFPISCYSLFLMEINHRCYFQREYYWDSYDLKHKFLLITSKRI